MHCRQFEITSTKFALIEKKSLAQKFTMLIKENFRKILTGACGYKPNGNIVSCQEASLIRLAVTLDI